MEYEEPTETTGSSSKPSNATTSVSVAWIAGSVRGVRRKKKMEDRCPKCGSTDAVLIKEQVDIGVGLQEHLRGGRV